MLPYFIVLPLAALVVLLIVWKTVRAARARWAIAGSLVAAAGIAVFALWAIFHSTSSTAAIGILFVPLGMAVAAPFGAVLGLMAHEALHHPRSVWGVVSVIGLVVVLGLAGTQVIQVVEFWRMQRETDGGVLSQAAKRNLAGKDYLVLAAIGANEHTPESTLLEIARYPDSGLHEKRTGWIQSFDRDQLAVVRKVIRNPRAPVEALVALADSNNDYVRGDVAQQKRTPVKVLRKLAAGRRGYLLEWGLAVNPATPPDILATLPHERDHVVARQLARNPAVPLDLLAKLAEHPDEFVRLGVAGNAAATAEMLGRLSQDTSPMVVRQANARLRAR